MVRTNITQARKNLFKLVKDVQSSHEPIHIAGRDHSAVLISEDDWRSIEETLYLSNIPDMHNSITSGLKEPLSESSTTLDW